METLQRTANRGSVSTGYDVANGCAFDRTRSEKLTRAQTTGTNRKKFTASTWIKRGSLNIDTAFFSASASGNDVSYMNFNSDNYLRFRDTQSGTSNIVLQTHREFMDVSAWYHIVLRVDTTQSTAANRVRIYVNGVQETAFSTETYPDQNYDTFWGYNGGNLEIGTVIGESFWDGNMCEVVLIDGTSAAPTEFGEFSDTGQWIPIDPSGLTFGNNGFYLDFEDSSNMGNDKSGGTDFSESNISATDQSQDTCTNNFATWNFNTGIIEGNGAAGFSGGNLIRQGVNGAYNACVATIGINPYVGTASWYWELEITANNDGNGIECAVGWASENIIVSDAHAQNNIVNAGFTFYTSTNYDPPNSGTGAAGDIFGMHLQCDPTNPTFKWYKNDTLVFTDRNAQHTIDNGFYFPYAAAFKNTMEACANFGNPIQEFAIASGNSDASGFGTFEFSTKSGYALCTKNLAEHGG
jgi:hypothetical protein|tara:strand:- start:86 stop:1483 length:1398 start_codon:yes stop_codon:yes gene_type:complete